MYSRPKPSETEGDILSLQEEFQRNQSENKVKLAATVVSKKQDEVPQRTEDTIFTDIQDQIANTFEAIPTHSNLGKIVEKSSGDQPIPLTFSETSGFPKPKRREIDDNVVPGCSIFAKQFKRLKCDVNVKLEPKTELPTKSFILSGNENDAIHNENINKMKSMTDQEILEEREQLVAAMDPAIIAFLKSRRQQNEIKSNKTTLQQPSEIVQDIELQNIETTKNVMCHPEAEKWLNFGNIEATKLSWMQDVEIPKIEKNKSFEARFNFEGWLLPYTEKAISEKSRSLYHHGEEPGRPGYTLQELFHLSRSTVTQQKIVALNTIANILELQSTGIYDDVIDIPIEQIFFVLRFCLDDNTPGVLNAAVKAMRNLFYSRIDETCLDCLLGFGLGQVQPILAIDHAQEDDKTINDQQLAETNLVKCLARTEILIRIRYIINTIKPPIETIVYCMDILTRLVRDSQFILNKVYLCENLINKIIGQFMPSRIKQNDSNSPYGLPLLQVVTFLRILATRDKKIAVDLVEKHSVMNSVLVYLSNDSYSKNANGLKLQTESMHLWSVFLHYGLTFEYFATSIPVLMELLKYHFNNTDLDMSSTYIRQSHVASLLILIGHYAEKKDLIRPFIALIHQCTIKWFKQFQKLTHFSCGKLQIIASLLECLAFLYSEDDVPSEVEHLVVEFLGCDSFSIITRTLPNGSMLLNNYTTHKSSPNLRSVETAAWYCSEHVIPIIQTNSPIPFLTALSNFVEKTRNYQIKLAFVQCENIVNYLVLLKKLNRYYLSSHWFTRIESTLIINILKASIITKENLDTRLFYYVAVKCLSVFTADQKPNIHSIFTSIVFSRQFYPSEVLMKNLCIDQQSQSLETSLNNLNEIRDVYIQVLGLHVDVPNFENDLSLDASKGNIIAIDWIYIPIIVLYSNQQHNKPALDEAHQIFVIRNCLRWILIYDTYFPELALCINSTDRFCRIACVFLGSDSLFLIEEIDKLLQLCLKSLMKKQSEINFDKEIQGLSGFQDFYTQLLEQYQGVSYGNVLFGNFILVPLAQRHSSKWRKILWSEYFGVVETFNVTVEQSVCPIDLFLIPEEDDLSLLKCYRRALVSNSMRKHSILYVIAKHHVEKYIENKKNFKK